MRHLCVVMLLVVAGCGESVTTQPSPSPTPTPTLLPLTLSVTGSVVDTAHRNLSGARAEVVDGQRAGAFATTDDNGRFMIPGKLPLAPFTLRVTRDGYVSTTIIWPPAGRAPTGEWVDLWFELTLVGPQLNMTGTYTLTLTADSTCLNLPDEVRTRTYPATIEQESKPTDFRLKLSGARFFLPHDNFGLQTAGGFVQFYVYRYFDEVEPGVVEQVQDNVFLAITGIAPTSVDPSGFTTITAPMEGSFEYCPAPPIGNPYRCNSSSRVTCASANHRLTLVRR